MKISAKRKSLQIGHEMENLACAHLKKAKLRLLLRNYRCKMGEIDLIMQDNQYLVFLEVRYRSQANYGSSLESITPIKERKLIRTAQYYLLTHQHTTHLARFDIVAIDKINNTHNIYWLKNAIELTQI
jgi:putative endonuclease